MMKREIRPGIPMDCLGARIDEMAAAEKSLTEEQRKLVEADFGGSPQIIRGVAGSGKTWVLANHLARRVASHSQGLPGLAGEAMPRVGVVCFNRCLVPFIKERFSEAYEKLPHGARHNCSITLEHMNRFIYRLSPEYGGPISYINVNPKDSRDAMRRAKDYLGQVRRLKQSGALERWLFDTIYLDEGQDFEEEEYRLLLELIRPDSRTGEKNLIVFYDDAQNVYSRPRPRWVDLGINVSGLRSRVMKECQRNTREIIEFAFNVLLGSCAEEGARVTTRKFADVDTLKDNGLITEEDGSLVQVHFAKRSGPRPVVKKFEDREAERAWVAQEVARLIDEEHVRPEDILILTEEGGGLRGLDQAITARCKSKVGFSEPHRDSQKDDFIFKPGRLTTTTTRSAKGYDGYVVFVVGTDTFPTSNEGRASFYVGCSRARLLLYVTGIGGNRICGKGRLMDEAEAVSKDLEMNR
jgi:superfamily I DNA and RNA helicase